MKILRLFFTVFSAVVLLSCESVIDGILGGVGLVDPEDVDDFSFSYRIDVDGGRYVLFRDSQQLAQNPDRLDASDRFNTVYLDRVYTCAISTKPADASLVGVSVSSSDPEIVKVEAGTTPLDYRISVVGVGECEISVKLGDSKGIVEKVYPIRAMAKLGLELGLNGSGSKVLYRVTEMPSNVKTALCLMTDSVTVHIACHFVDDERGIDRIDREVHPMARNSHYDVFCERFRRVLSNQTSFFNQLERRYMKGTKAVRTEDGEIEYEERKCYWYVEQIECGCSFVSEDPYYVFDCVIAEDSLDPSNPDYFVVSMIDNMSFDQRKEVSDDLSSKSDDLAENGVNLDDVLNYTDEEMDDFINGLNDFFND